MPNFKLDVSEKEVVLLRAARAFAQVADNSVYKKQADGCVWKAFGFFGENLSLAIEGEALEEVKGIIESDATLISYIEFIKRKEKEVFENRVDGEFFHIINQNDDLIGIAKQSQADQKETKAELIATRAELKENEKKSSKVNARYFFAGIAVSALLTFLPAQLNKNWIYPKRPTYFVTSFLPKALLSRKPGIERGKRFYFEGPVVSFGNGKKPKHPSYEKETGSSQKSADRFAPKVAL